MLVNGSTPTNSIMSAVVEAVHFEQAGVNGPDASSTTGASTTPLDHNHHVTIEIDPDQRHDGHHQRFWKGYILEREDPTGSVIVGFARALDDSNVSRSQVITNLNEMVRRNGYLLNGAEDLTIGNPIEGMPSPSSEILQNSLRFHRQNGNS